MESKDKDENENVTSLFNTPIPNSSKSEANEYLVKAGLWDLKDVLIIGHSKEGNLLWGTTYDNPETLNLTLDLVKTDIMNILTTDMGDG